MGTKYILLLFFVVGTLLSMDNPDEGSSGSNHKRRSSLVRASALLEKIRSPRKKKGSRENGTQDQDDESPGSPKKKNGKPKVKPVERAKKTKRPDSTDEHKFVINLIGDSCPEYNKLLLNNPGLKKVLCAGHLHNLKHSEKKEEREKYAMLVEAGKKSSSSSSGSNSHSDSGEDN